MLKKSCLNAERQSTLLRIFSGLLLKAHAEEDPNPTPPPAEPPKNEPSAPQINFEQLIAQARKEEKEKLYPRIKKLEEDNKALLSSNNTLLLEKAAAVQELENFKVGGSSAESEAVKELRKTNKALEDKIKEYEKAPTVEAIRAELEAEYSVKDYRREQMITLKDEILPVFAELVTGKTKEEIDKSIETAKQKTKETREYLGLSETPPTPPTPGPTPPRPPVTNPSVNQSGAKTFDVDYVRNLKPGSKEYAEWRKAQGLK